VVNQPTGAGLTWGFSPCGDAIGAVDDHEPAQEKDAIAFATLAPDPLGSVGPFPATEIATLSVDNNHHLVTHGTATESIGTNTAPNACPPPPANDPPTAAFSAPASRLSLLPVQFTDQSSDSDGRVASFSWSFGDGQSSNLRNPIHLFLAAGRFTVTLTVTDDRGATGSVPPASTMSSPSPISPPTTTAWSRRIGASTTSSSAGRWCTRGRVRRR
jgi:PKD repeat protein